LTDLLPDGVVLWLFALKLAPSGIFYGTFLPDGLALNPLVCKLLFEILTLVGLTIRWFEHKV
jgi:hypothetical protein